MSEFLTDVKTIREQARQDIMSGPVTSAYGTGLGKVIELLNAALATEVICVLRYRQHHFTAEGLDSEPVAGEFLQHSAEEQEHADKLADRIVQAGDLREMIRGNLVAERIAIASYTEMINWIGTSDPTTRRVLEEVLAKEEEHADDMLTFLQSEH